MTSEQIKEKFKDARKIEFTEDGQAFIYYAGGYPLIFEVEGN